MLDDVLPRGWAEARVVTLLAAVSLLVLTSSFAAVLGLFNNSARYLYALGRDGVLPRSLAGSGSARCTLTDFASNAARTAASMLCSTTR